jgi:peptidoglycan/LPS O-acetylase OafA/YrhL
MKDIKNQPISNRLDWVEWLKAFALIWIFINHAAERLFGYPLIANPSAEWPPLADRMSQLAPLSGSGTLSVLDNVFRYVGWFGDQGVQLFLILSGFGLAWGLLAKSAPDSLPLKNFYLRRLERLYPLWWGAHLLFFAAWFLTGKGLDFTQLASWLSFIGIRLTPATIYHFSPAWWYFGLILQLYLVFPLLWKGLKKWGAFRFFLVVSLVSFVIRAAGLLVFTDYLDVWQRGGIFITRLPEFAFGMSLAAWMSADQPGVRKRLTAPLTLLLAVAGYALGIALSLSLIGMTIAPFMLGVSAFVILYALFTALLEKIPARTIAVGSWIGVHSYSLYLMHHPVINRLLPEGQSVALMAYGRVAAALALTVVAGLVLEWTVNWFTGLSRKSIQTRGLSKTLLTVGIFAVVLLGLLFASEALIRRFAPQEVLGWGERPSLEISQDFGWRLIPNQSTRLRWQSYDYTLQANSLGFPGPEYLPQKDPAAYRILVTGDAFSSAEGVNTDQSWPRLLEQELQTLSDRRVEVMNFAMTGYGPTQYAAVVGSYAPVYQPDLIVVEMFVNDFDDVYITNEQFQWSIGFYNPDPDGLRSFLQLENLRSFIRWDVLDPGLELVTGEPQTQGYFLGNFAMFEKWRAADLANASQDVQQQLEAIQDTASQVGADVLVVFVPASIQVCQPQDLAYYPRHVAFEDASLYNAELPQNLIAQVGSETGIPVWDLRSAFSAADACPYQPQNMHWTVYGHELVAEYVADQLMDTGLVR